MDIQLRDDPQLAKTSKGIIEFLEGQVQLAINSFWAFDADPTTVWQVRRLRRYMNWYWRRAQLRNTRSMTGALLLFSRAPKIELGGVGLDAEGRRTFVDLAKLDPTTFLEIGIVTEDDKLVRFGQGADLDLMKLLHSFATRDKEAIKVFFNALFAKIDAGTGALPSETEVRLVKSR
jgi:hypothetical protein